MSVRVRFAPAPTGNLTVGGGRTALFNWLFARNRGGVFILRSDDTDAERSTPEFHRDIVDSLRWLGLEWDEGVEVGGPHGSYRQSDRLDRYREVAAGLVERGLAYYDAATAEQLADLRARAEAEGRTPVYAGQYRASPEEAGDGLPIRFAVPRPGRTEFDDLVRGHLGFDHANLGDFVILRSDGTPTYHLASTVDDVDYQVTQVVRGEDLLPSTPNHILLTEAMGAPRAEYAHLPLIHGADGQKLSKRHGDTSLQAYREAGYLPAAVRNYLALLGWSPGGDEEIVPLAAMVERFDLAEVSKNPAVFDPAKLEWMNGVYLRALAVEDLAEMSLPLVEADLGRELGPEERDTFAEILPLVQERARLLSEIAPQVRFIFAEVEIDPASWEKVMGGDQARLALETGLTRLRALDEWTTPSIEAALRGVLGDLGLSASKGLQPLRVAATGSAVSPPLFESLAALGRERAIRRIEEAVERLRTPG